MIYNTSTTTPTQQSTPIIYQVCHNIHEFHTIPIFHFIRNTHTQVTWNFMNKVDMNFLG
jgi:hypothetical protein